MRRPGSRAPRFGCALAAAAFAVLFAATAAAHSDFPGIIQETFGSSCAPQCTLCHVNPAGGLPLKVGEHYVDGMNPSHRGFGVFISNLAARPPSGTPTSANLAAKLKALKGTPCNNDPTQGNVSDTGDCDTDGDGVTDFAELDEQPARDPDVSGAGNNSVCPSYGCGASSSASIGTLPRDADATGRAAAVMAALGVALVLARRARR